MTDFKASLVSIIRCDDYDPGRLTEAMEQLLAPLGGMGAFVHAGASVVLKPNFLWPSSVERAVCTHPEVIRATAQLARAAQASSVVVTDSCGIGSATRCARKLGLLGGDLLSIADTDDPREVSHASAAFHKLTLSARMMDAGALINLAKAKTHGHMVVTGAVKNTFGAVVGLEKIQWHMRSGRDQRSFAQLLVHIHETVRPCLSIVDAITAMEGNGPGSGSPRPMGLLLASRSGYCLDAVLCHLWGLEPVQVPTWQVALEHGYAPPLSAIEIVGPPLSTLVAHPQWKMARPAHLRQVGGLSFLSPVLEKLIRILPVLDEGPCTSCGRCGEVCGKAAIELRDVGKGGKLVPVIDKKKCISCFCCQEMCPEGALRVQAGVLARWLGLSH
ncbi:MAG: DUF362 domain-containing protein [Myxococcota bacterium]|jgi:uncharacterized protein (DUF362 family)/NAD-dependent dihydropyrimidine dehydrogenase PreA subunit|nr:DUF362 domain-containing protein [Myxococcota bacterium]